ncbi:MAG: ABC transporter ATP-binding protein [Nitrospirae bacterium]|nr:ABC transporter ATP-binding protein [Nitrospirota bacterium]
MPLLSIRNLSVSIPHGKHTLKAVDNLSFDIEKGEVFGLVGESGCGKSMTALSIMHLLPSSAKISGEILFNGENLLSLTEDKMRGVRGGRFAMIFQEPMTSLNPVLTIGYQIAEMLITHRDMSKKDAMARAVELLALVKVPSPDVRVKQYPHQMSGGMRQRVMIAMALACNPELIIADEPTTALDVTIQAQILELMDELRATTGTSMLFITHDLGIVSEMARRTMVMYAGAAMELADSADLFREPLHPYTRGLLESLPSGKGKKLQPIPGSVPQPGEFPPGCRFAPRCGYKIDVCDRAEPEFREIGNGRKVRCVKAEDFLHG